MKKARILLLVLLALMLPLRNAMGAAMICAGPFTASSNQDDLRAAHRAAGMHSSDTMRAGGRHLAAHGGTDSSAHSHLHAAAHSEAASTGHMHDDASGSAPADAEGNASHDCSLCAGFCSLTLILPTQPTLSAAPTASPRYPCIAAPAPSFFSGGQERPPRTI